MKKIAQPLKTLFIALILLAGIAFIPADRIAKAASYSVLGYAWSDNIGWINLNPALGGVFVDGATGDFFGFAWSDNIGWVSFDSGDLSGCPSGICAAGMDLTTGKISGWAKALGAEGSGWDGWISLSGISPDYGVNMDTSTGGFSGWGWGSDVVGWVSFDDVSCPECAGITYQCSDGADNDSNGCADYPNDSGCSSALDDDESGGVCPPPTQCSDGLDNDSNGCADYPNDTGCLNSSDDDESGGNCPIIQDYDLSSSGSLSATIIKDSGPVNSKGTAIITVSGAINFSDNVLLTSNASSVIPGAVGVFSPDNRLDYIGPDYESAAFSVQNIPDSTSSGLYIITIYGNDEGGILPAQETTVRLNIGSFNPKWREF